MCRRHPLNIWQAKYRLGYVRNPDGGNGDAMS